ncbi:MAG: hypothetical protein U0835_15255 [Isosphaeraceae bacterium]
MSRSLRIAVADEPACAVVPDHPLLGHGRGRGQDGRDLVEKCRLAHPDLVVPISRCPTWTASTRRPNLPQRPTVPVILVSAYHDPSLIAQAENHVLAFLVKPIKQADLDWRSAIASRRFEQFQALRERRPTSARPSRTARSSSRPRASS